MTAEAGFASRAVAAVIIQALRRSVQHHEPPVLGEPLWICVAPVLPAEPVGHPAVFGFQIHDLLLHGQDLRAACRAAEDAVWEETHLRVTALVGVVAEDLG